VSFPLYHVNRQTRIAIRSFLMDCPQRAWAGRESACPFLQLRALLLFTLAVRTAAALLSKVPNGCVAEVEPVPSNSLGSPTPGSSVAIPPCTFVVRRSPPYSRSACSYALGIEPTPEDDARTTMNDRRNRIRRQPARGGATRAPGLACANRRPWGPLRGRLRHPAPPPALQPLQPKGPPCVASDRLGLVRRKSNNAMFWSVP